MSYGQPVVDHLLLGFLTSKEISFVTLKSVYVDETQQIPN